MAEPSAEESLSLPAPLDDFALVEQVAYPNGGQSSFYEYASIALIVDDDICERPEDQPVFDYSLITSKQNEYVARNDRVYRFLREDIDEAEQYLRPSDREQEDASPRGPDKTNLADASPLEMAFEEHFSNVYGSDSTRYLWKEYAITDMEGHDRYIDYLVRTKDGMLEEMEKRRARHEMLPRRFANRKQQIQDRQGGPRAVRPNAAWVQGAHRRTEYDHRRRLESAPAHIASEIRKRHPGRAFPNK